eukprot:3138835-Prymnesium_polylepis.7
MPLPRRAAAGAEVECCSPPSSSNWGGGNCSFSTKSSHSSVPIRPSTAYMSKRVAIFCDDVHSHRSSSVTCRALSTPLR